MENLYKEMFLETLFSNEKITYTHTVDKKLSDTKITVLNPALVKLINNLWQKYAHKYNRNHTAYISDCAFYAWEAIQRFEIRNGSTWEAIAKGNDKNNTGKLINSIKSNIRHSLQKQHSDCIETTKTVFDEEGNKHTLHVYSKLKLTSIDKLLSHPEDNGMARKQIEESSSFWNAKKDGQMDAFTAWLAANKHRILTKSQLELLDKLEHYDYFGMKELIPVSELQDSIEGVSWKNLATRLNNIRERILKAWQQEKRFFNKSFAVKSLNKQVNLLNMAVEIVENTGNIKEVNSVLSSYIRSNIDSAIVEHIIYDLISEKAQKAIIKGFNNKTVIESFALYEFYACVENEIERLEHEIVREQAIFEQMKERSHVIIPEYYAMPENGKSIYLELNTDGILLPPSM